jgi:death-on-curing protein
VVDAIHHDQLREHGGLPGIRDENLLESALARAKQKWHHSESPDLAFLAAAYAFGLLTSHPYRDGNKRIGFLAMVTFLEVNGHEFAADEAEIVAEFLDLAGGCISEEALAAWIRARTSKSR